MKVEQAVVFQKFMLVVLGKVRKIVFLSDESFAFTSLRLVRVRLESESQILNE
jgi:hypothetical protein